MVQEPIKPTDNLVGKSLSATALANVDKDNDGEIDWNDFNVFCDQQQVSMDQRKSIWKQLGGTIDNDSFIVTGIKEAEYRLVLTVIDSDNFECRLL